MSEWPELVSDHHSGCSFFLVTPVHVKLMDITGHHGSGGQQQHLTGLAGMSWSSAVIWSHQCIDVEAQSHVRNVLKWFAILRKNTSHLSYQRSNYYYALSSSIPVFMLQHINIIFFTEDKSANL